MQHRTYDVRVRRRRGRWVASVPELPADAPRVTTDLLGNVAPDMIAALSGYLGVHETLISVQVPHPVRPARRRWRDRVTMGVLQIGGSAIALTGVYHAVGAAATLITGGIGVVAAAALKEAGRL